MTKILLPVFFSFTISLAQYTTPNTGVNWGLDDLVANSSGVVTGSFPNFSIINKVIISANDKLTISPGSIINISGSTSGFEVNGSFIAEGTILDSIVITSSNHDSTGAFDGLRFNDTSVDSLCRIEYLKIEYAEYGVRCFTANPSIKNSYFYKCSRGFNLSGSSPTISHNKIELCYEYGITMTTGSSPLVEWNELANNNTQNTSPKNQISVGTQGNNSPAILHNKIYGGTNFRTGGISIATLIAGSSSSSEIAYNEIYNNSFGIALAGGDLTCNIHDNKIYNNNINPDVNVSGSGINMNGDSSNAPIIRKNEIFGNWWGITIQNGTTIQAGPQPNIGNLTTVDPNDDGLNIIYNNVQGFNVYDLFNNCTNDIYAQNNDWRVYDSLLIEQHVVHKADSTLRGTVVFTPFSSFIPVELTSFSVKVSDGKLILKWTTATEKNNNGFEIERIVGSSEYALGKWEKIEFINGKGTTTEQQNYSFIDYDIQTGKYFYRLKQIDFDGTFKFSSEIEIEIVPPRKFELSQNYPNPFNPATTLSFVIGHSSFVTLKVYDALGNEIATLVHETKQPGAYAVSFDGSNLASGIYIYQLKAANFISVKKMVLMK